MARLFNALKRLFECSAEPIKQQEPLQLEKEQKPAVRFDALMTSQLVALFLSSKDTQYRTEYTKRLADIGFSEHDAEKMLSTECGIYENHPAPALLQEHYTRSWYFTLQKPIFTKSQESLFEEYYFTISEICKIIDEAEWHFWNSHERDLPDGVFEEIYAWRLGGQGGIAAIDYFKNIATKAGVDINILAAYTSREGGHLKRYKWGRP